MQGSETNVAAVEGGFKFGGEEGAELVYSDIHFEGEGEREVYVTEYIMRQGPEGKFMSNTYGSGERNKNEELALILALGKHCQQKQQPGEVPLMWYQESM